MAKPYGRLYQKGKNVSIMGIDTYDVWPIGSIFMSIYATNPSTYFGGTWERISQGRFLIGVKENNNYQENNIPDFGETTGMKGYLFMAEDKGGEYKHLITQLETGLREHTHQLRLTKDAGVGSYSDCPVRGVHGSNVDGEFRTGRVTGLSDKSNDYGAPFVDGTISANAMESHNNMPPYFGVYMWKRTA